MASRPELSLAIDGLNTPANWEERALNRVPAESREQFLERSRQIIEAAYDLLDEEGLEGLTIRAVLKKTGLARRAFYDRFAGKDDLVLAVFEQTIRAAVGFFAEQVKTLPDFMERIKLVVIFIVMGKSTMEGGAGEESGRVGAAMSREHLRLAESRPHDLQAALNPLITLIAQLLADGMEAGQVREYAPQRLASLVYNLVSTTVHTELLAEDGAEPDRGRRTELAGEIWEFCRRAIAA